MIKKSKRFSRLLLIYTPLLVILVIVLKYAAPTQYRVFRYNLPDITDYRIFENRVLPPSPLAAPLRYRPETDRLRFEKQFEQSGLQETVLESDSVAFLVLSDGQILYESYRDGFGPGDPVMVFSITKSILSLLAGIAIDDGLIQSLDQPVSDFLPSFKQTGLEAIRLSHLLQMTSGLPYVERTVNNPFGLHAHLSYTDDIAGLLEHVEPGSAPGEVFSYKSIDYALLGLVLDRALGDESLSDYFYRKLWYPMGATSTGLWSVDSSRHGMEKTWCGLSMSARDLARIGLLVLDQGRWNGQQLVPPDWLMRINATAAATQPSTSYRYGWWQMPGESLALRAEGVLGQFLYVNPGERIVIVRLGRSLGDSSWEQWTQVLTDTAALAH